MSQKLSPALEEFIRTGKVVFNPSIPDISNDPALVKIAKEAQEWLLKVGLPDFEKLSKSGN